MFTWSKAINSFTRIPVSNIIKYIGLITYHNEIIFTCHWNGFYGIYICGVKRLQIRDFHLHFPDWIFPVSEFIFFFIPIKKNIFTVLNKACTPPFVWFSCNPIKYFRKSCVEIPCISWRLFVLQNPIKLSNFS